MYPLSQLLALQWIRWSLLNTRMKKQEYDPVKVVSISLYVSYLERNVSRSMVFGYYKTQHDETLAIR